MAMTDPGEAGELLGLVPGEVQRASALGRLALALAATDIERAERIALSLADDRRFGWVLGNLVRRIAATDPDRARRLAGSLPEGNWYLTGIADETAASESSGDVVRLADAGRAAASITDERAKVSALLGLAHDLGAIASGRAA